MALWGKWHMKLCLMCMTAQEGEGFIYVGSRIEEKIDLPCRPQSTICVSVCRKGRIYLVLHCFAVPWLTNLGKVGKKDLCKLSHFNLEVI